MNRNMYSNKEKWIEDVLGSMDGSQRAKVPSDLFRKIEAGIAEPKIEVIPMRRFRIVATAAAILLLLNVFSMRHYSQASISTDEAELVTSTYTEQSLISNYKIYDL